MRILVLGGTVFLGRAVAAEAVRRGHEVLCAVRGRSGQVPEGAAHVPVDRDQGLGALAGESFDAVVDLATMSVTWVREAVRSLRAGHWAFVSSCSVYADHATPGRTETLPPLEDEPGAPMTPERYGSVKVASEDAVREVRGDDAFIVRAGLITGPGDRSDRFGYWANRLSRGGRVAVPDVPDQPAQHVDVRDLAAWVVDSAEHRTTGTFDAIGPANPLSLVLGEVAGAVAPQGTELVRVPEEVLHRHEVAPWSGPRSLPLWLPATHRSLMFRDAGPALAAGLRVRSTAETAVDSLAHERALGLDRPRRAGLPADAEEALLTAVG
ncbi:NAD-dependent epimerase/dehydratase family protein [Saccharothrix algeriensis]|uniref:NAD-dependent epimerase/dehydratase family protein n=1 Tax=Saccharothrix algeriensis TaxID=173560 RepID=A0A8T8HRF8_9PSEU|nr:NAD-dependent epimerase/dehydratase family protein [Saccharothrix algeriensis]MBM7812409.1 nucleoside-diphosphate-sugar epimerase [Saccharothrix algeriensis]QTR01163.1 NAD-dependent epimerase/dehydratase family protein [Saccharothrix algeriensis]